MTINVGLGLGLLTSFLAAAFAPIPAGGNDVRHPALAEKVAAADTETQAIGQLIEEMYASWNRHNIEAFMTSFWQSDELLTVIDDEMFYGWNALYRSYVNGYPDRNAMGSITLNRIHVKLLRPDFAVVVTWWTFEYLPRPAEIAGSSTMNLQKFPDGWRIVFTHSVL
ncbi:MAG: SgcJ/EcaC family oxidoreductase [Verrucomicrobia bacterium]|nr:SgcJ/EcaC family oxidoreductase [Verrucomicrobiota bacterium]